MDTQKSCLVAGPLGEVGAGRREGPPGASEFPYLLLHVPFLVPPGGLPMTPVSLVQLRTA